MAVLEASCAYVASGRDRRHRRARTDLLAALPVNGTLDQLGDLVEQAKPILSKINDTDRRAVQTANVIAAIAVPAAAASMDGANAKRKSELLAEEIAEEVAAKLVKSPGSLRDTVAALLRIEPGSAVL
jgi:hypothetical protein